MNAATLEQIQRFLFHDEMRALKSLLTADPSLLTSRDPETGRSILSIAVFDGNEKAVNWLIQEGVDLLAQNKHGTTPLHLAFRIRSGAIAALLYYYEAHIFDGARSEKTMQLYREFLEGRPDGWRREEREVFLTQSATLSKQKPALPQKTMELTLKNLGRLPSESKESDGSGSGSGSGTDPAEVLLSVSDGKSVSDTVLRHRTVFAAAAAAAAAAAPYTGSSKSADGE